MKPKMKILSSFTRPFVTPNLYDILSSEHKREIFWKKVLGFILFIKWIQLAPVLFWTPSTFIVWTKTD